MTSQITSEWSAVDGQGRDAVEAFMQVKVVVEGWPMDWSRKL